MTMFHYSDNYFDRCNERRPQSSIALEEYLVLDFIAASEM